MIKPVSINEYLQPAGGPPLLDVRTPAEFAHGHVPGAFNLPLFSNEERVSVGTTYKQVSREEAILLGFELTGSKWAGFIRQALAIAPDKQVAVHCWRGGMRSGAMAWALNLYGFEVQLIEGGYKQYRNWVHQRFAQDYHLQILGGMTGSGKTRILHELRKLGEQVVDLEELAQHQGSSYGSKNLMVQPSQEQFENNLAEQLAALDACKRIWVEDESMTVGKCIIPPPLWRQIRDAPLLHLNVDIDQRITSLAAEYGVLDKDFLIEATGRIQKRLGPEQTRRAVQAIQEDRMEDFVRLALVYYDKTYRTGLSKRNAGQVQSLDVSGLDATANARQILAAMRASAHQTL